MVVKLAEVIKDTTKWGIEFGQLIICDF